MNDNCETDTGEPAEVMPSVAHLVALRELQPYWERTSFRARRRIMRRFNQLLFLRCRTMASLLLPRPVIDSVTAEILPLLSASRFLIRNAEHLLKSRNLSILTRPLWLFGVTSKVERRPLGCVLILAPGNYPLMLAGIQVLQAVMAGNVVALKPAPGRRDVMAAFVDLLEQAGLPTGIVTLLNERDGPAAIRTGYDLIILTGSEQNGRAVAEAAAKTLTPTIMELSGADPVFVLPGADLDLVARAIFFGLSLNQGETCIAPRRVFIDRKQESALMLALGRWLGAPDSTVVTNEVLSDLIDRVSAKGGRVFRFFHGTIFRLEPDLAYLADIDCFSPWCAIIPVSSMEEACALDHVSTFGLGASIFGPEPEARAFSDLLHAGSITINDLIAPTADPRLSFGGIRRSGYGVTRGSEGLLALTRPVNISMRRRAAFHLLPAVLRER